MIKEYSLNRYLKLLKSVNILKNSISVSASRGVISFQNKEAYNTLVILIIMYLGENRSISYSFSQLVQLLNANTEQVKRTNLTITLGEKIVRLIRYLKFESNPALEKIYPLNALKSLLKNLAKL